MKNNLHFKNINEAFKEYHQYIIQLKHHANQLNKISCIIVQRFL